ncbi:MAG: hypothetical protein JJU37_05100 [Balneolaceae bacterium]|nr:hypothetical protein [Balneolaceae bacterium]
MLKQFVTLNVKIWWRSLAGVEIAAMIFYSVFLLLILGQFLGVILILIFMDDVEQARQFYSWITEDIQFTAHLLFLNSLFFSQIFFVKINRLQLNENRKLLSFGMSANRLAWYLNLAGFFHPLNVIFLFVWLMYLISMAGSASHIAMVTILVFVTYGVISSLKWRFRIFSAERFKHVSAVVGTFVLFFILIAVYLDFTPYISSPDVAADFLNSWLIYTPGYLFYYAGNLLTSTAIHYFLIGLLLFLFMVVNRDMMLNSKAALLTPPQSSSGIKKKSQLALFIKWLGHEGGKYFHAVWSHKYSKIQLLITYVFVIPYIIFLGNDTYVIGVFLTLIPIIFLMVMLTNMFGFENREILLSLQLPIPMETIVRERIKTALLVCLAGSSIVLILVPVFIESVPAMLQIHMGIIMISLAFLHYILRSSINNYKKIEEVSVMSVSNPVLPASITFTSVFIVMIIGVFTFFIIESFVWYHIAILVSINLILFISFRRKLARISEPFNQKVIPKLWNEL